MTVELIVVNGCSHTWGEELAEPTRSSWPSLMATALGAPVVNLAELGGSNHRLVRTTVEYLPRIIGDRDVEPARTLFVPMWTHPLRTEIRFTTRTPAFVHEPTVVDQFWHRVGPFTLTHRRRGKPIRIRAEAAASGWYRHLQHDVGDLDELLLLVVLLEQWLSTSGYQYAMACTGSFTSPTVLEQFSQYRARMDDCRYVGGLDCWGQRSFSAATTHLGDRGPGGHPLEASHRWYTDNVLLPHVASSGAR